MVVLIPIVLFGGYGLSAKWLLLPPLSGLVVAIAMAFGIWLAAINVRYRDVKHAVPFLVQVWFFVTPVVYSAEIIPDELWLLYHLNPMAGAIESFRWVFFGDNVALPLAELLLSLAVTMLLLLAGVAYFRRTERTFADVI